VTIFKFGGSQHNTGKAGKDRLPAVAGQFYENDYSKLSRNIKQLFDSAQPPESDNVIAVISPHAGYIYSGQVAASAFNQIKPDKKFENIFIIGTSHTSHFDGASIYNSGNYITPIGEVNVNISLASELIKKHDCFTIDDDSHVLEHSLEVQLPFLQYRLQHDFKIIPIIIATSSIFTVEKISNALKPYFTQDNLFVISTDFSHYPSYNDAVNTDKDTADAIISNNPKTLIELIGMKQKESLPGLATALCGWSSVLTLMYLTENKDCYNYKKIQYRNSGDVSGDKRRVVGYWAISVSQDNNKEDLLSYSEKRILLNIARKSIESYIPNNVITFIDTTGFTPALLMKNGAFVSIYKKRSLRGCIGRFSTDEPLYRLIRDMAIASSTRDTRFLPVSADELEDIEIEISVLTPMKKIFSINEIDLGKHGIYIESKGRTGTFLPQVARDTGWTKEEFLGHCARDKAGIGWNGWKKANIYTYEAIVFSDKTMKS